MNHRETRDVELENRAPDSPRSGVSAPWAENGTKG